jgi:hypothetical protein
VVLVDLEQRLVKDVTTVPMADQVAEAALDKINLVEEAL